MFCLETDSCRAVSRCFTSAEPKTLSCARSLAQEKDRVLRALFFTNFEKKNKRKSCCEITGFSFFRPQNIFFSATPHAILVFFVRAKKKTFVFFLIGIWPNKRLLCCNLPCFGILFLLLLICRVFFFVCLVCVRLRTLLLCFFSFFFSCFTSLDRVHSSVSRHFSFDFLLLGPFVLLPQTL